MNRVTIKRINGEMKMFLKNKPDNIKIYHNPENILEIYFKFEGYPNTYYNDGEYICKIVHNSNYPVKAPDLYILTPNGRFETNRKLCLTNTSYHQETWAPAAWNLETFIQAFISVFHSDSSSDRIGIGHIKTKNKEITIKYANDSKQYNENIVTKNKIIFV